MIIGNYKLTFKETSPLAEWFDKYNVPVSYTRNLKTKREALAQLISYRDSHDIDIIDSIKVYGYVDDIDALIGLDVMHSDIYNATWWLYTVEHIPPVEACPLCGIVLEDHTTTWEHGGSMDDCCMALRHISRADLAQLKEQVADIKANVKERP